MEANELELDAIGNGPPVLFVHGDVVGPASTWRKQRPLAERWRMIIPSRPGFGGSPPLERNDFELEAPLFAELLGDGAHLVGHSYGAVIALLAAAERPDAVRSLTVSEPGALRLAEGTPAVDEMIANGERLFREGTLIEDEAFLRLFRSGAGSAYQTPQRLPEELIRGVELLKTERPPWEAEIPLERLASAGFPVLVVSGGHSSAFEAVCDALASALSAERAVISGRGHTVPSNGEPYNDRLEAFLSDAEERRGSRLSRDESG
jgi:pimeloyl-ACP methyl ester carboxylesterase